MNHENNERFNVDVDEVRRLSLLMGFDMDKVLSDNYPHASPKCRGDYDECVLQTFLNQIFAENGEEDPYTNPDIPTSVKQLYWKLTEMEAADAAATAARHKAAEAVEKQQH